MNKARPSVGIRKKNRTIWETKQAEIDELRKEREKLSNTQTKELINRRILELNREQARLGDIKC